MIKTDLSLRVTTIPFILKHTEKKLLIHNKINITEYHVMWNTRMLSNKWWLDWTVTNEEKTPVQYETGYTLQAVLRVVYSGMSLGW
jgi:hypothetical protein